MWVFRTPGSLDAHDSAVLDALWDAGASGLEERDGYVRAYFDTPTDVPLHGEWIEEHERDWQEEWRKDLKPVRAGRFTIIPPWLRDAVPDGQQSLVIDVGMAFGTGHHTTTRLAVEALQALDLSGKNVLDIGTGSGVLAIAASLLGASHAVGVDIDPITIPAARDNALLNDFQADAQVFVHARTAGRLVFQEGGITDAAEAPGAPGTYDVIVANLYAELHDVLMPEYRAAISERGGAVVLTGILTERLALVRAALDRAGAADVQTRTEGEWALVTATLTREA